MKRGLRALGAAARGALLALLLLALVLSAALLRFALASRSRESLSRYDAAPKTGRFVKAGDVELFVQEAGPERAAKPAVLLIHGLAGWSGTWRETLDALAGAKRRALAVDMPPLGYSQRPEDGSYDDAAQARRLLALLDALRIKQAVVVGHSFGARAAVALALAAPKRVSALVLVDAALPPVGGVAAPAPPLARRVIALRPLRDALLSATIANPAQTKRIMAFFCADASCATDERAAVMSRPLAVEGTVAAFGRFLETAAAGEPSPDYARLSMPSLLLWGEADTATPLAGAMALRRAIPGSSLWVVPRAGHLLPIEDARGFDAALLAFLGGGPLTRAGVKVLASGHETHAPSGAAGRRGRP